MVKALQFIPAFASFFIGAGLEVSGIEIPWLGYSLIGAGVLLFAIPFWPMIGRLRVRSPIVMVNQVASPNPLHWLKSIRPTKDDSKETIQIAKGWMDFHQERELAVERLTTLTIKIGVLAGKLSGKLEGNTQKFLKLGNNIGKGRKIANRMAADMNQYAQKLSVNATEMGKYAEEFVSGQQGFLAWKTEESNRMTESQRQEAVEEFQSLSVALTELKTTIESNLDAIDSMEGNTQNLNAACQNVKVQLQRFITIEESLIHSCDEAVNQLGGTTL